MGVLFLAFLTITSLVFSLQAFAGKDVILDDAYLKASEEERKGMDRKAYRLQAAIIFLFLAAISLCNLLRAVLHMAVFTYLAAAFAVAGILYAIVSHYALRKKQ